MRKIVLLIGALSVMAAISCTGLNSGVYEGLTANTNPAPEYAGPGSATRGGLIFHSNTIAGQVGAAKSIKTGEACSTSILWLIAFGDSSIGTAATNGSITKIATVDHSNTAFLMFLYHGHCTVVTGE